VIDDDYDYQIVIFELRLSDFIGFYVYFGGSLAHEPAKIGRIKNTSG
jgi:hypothetical protein